MLNNPIGVYLYLILRNDISWNLLSYQEKDRVLKANKFHNVEREDYKNPEKYGTGRIKEGENWDSFDLKAKDDRGQILLKTLNMNKPVRVLEIGPGAGFYSRLICEYPTVEYYTAIDINQAFLDYLCPRLEALKSRKKFFYKLIRDNFTAVGLTGEYDLIVLLSTVHHIPDRNKLFAKVHDLLKDDGVVFCFDPSHYLYRIITLTIKCFINGYLNTKYFSDKNNLSTHHMCSAGEFRRICNNTSLTLENIYYKLPRQLSKLNRLFFIKAWFSNEMGVVLRKYSAGNS